MVRVTKNDRVLIGYARVSTAEQSLEMQIEALERYGVPKNNIAVETVSGAASKRPALDGILNDLRPGDTLVAWRLDRIGRDIRDLLDKMAFIEERGATFHSLTEHFDTKTPAGRMHMQFAMMMADHERNVTIERTREGVRAAVERGVKFGQDPLLSPAQRKQAQKMRDSGMSVRRIAEQFGCSHNTIRNWTSGLSRKRKRKAR